MAGTQEIITMLTKSYEMEIETVTNYIANSTNLDGVRAEEIKKSLRVDVAEELAHAQELGDRIKELGGVVPGSASIQLVNRNSHRKIPPTWSASLKQ